MSAVASTSSAPPVEPSGFAIDASDAAAPNVATHNSTAESQLAGGIPEGMDENAWGGDNAWGQSTDQNGDDAGNTIDRQEDQDVGGEEMTVSAVPSKSAATTEESTSAEMPDSSARQAQSTPPPRKDEQNQASMQTPAPPAPKTPKKYRGIPEDVKLFEVFWVQVVQLIRARPDLSIQDITALLVSLINLSLSCYPDQLEYVDQVLAFAREKVGEYQQSPDFHTPATASNLNALLVSPINSYLTVLTLLALPNYTSLLAVQPYATRKNIANAVVMSVLKNETVMSTPEDVDGVLELCSTIIKDQKDFVTQHQQFGGYPNHDPRYGGNAPMYGGHRQQQAMVRQQQQMYDYEEMAEEQGWIARAVHLMRSDDPETQFSLLQSARKHFVQGGERIRFTLPPLIAAAVKLARRYKLRQKLETSWESKMLTLYKFVHQVITTLYNLSEASSETCLRLFLLAAQSADETGFEELCYEFYVQAFTIYEESISESKRQINAVTLIMSTLFTSRCFGADNYDTLITKAALHGAKLLKKPHQAKAVMLASHLWWQTEVPGRPDPQGKALLRDGKRVLECLQKSLRIANSCVDERSTIDIFCSALDQYLYYVSLYERVPKRPPSLGRLYLELYLTPFHFTLLCSLSAVSRRSRQSTSTRWWSSLQTVSRHWRSSKRLH